jgi:hypothetical protein
MIYYFIPVRVAALEVDSRCICPPSGFANANPLGGDSQKTVLLQADLVLLVMTSLAGREIAKHFRGTGLTACVSRWCARKGL